MIAKTTDMGFICKHTEHYPISDNVAKLMYIHQHSTLSNNDSKT